MAWGRSEWKRSAADSAKRRHRLLDKPSHERTDERLRIVSDELWQVAKARQTQQSDSLARRVKGALALRKVGAGPPARHLLSGLLRCSACEASFVLSNGNRYQCASHVNGAACDVTLSVPRVRVENTIIECVETELFNPARLSELEARYAAAAQSPPVDHSARIAELEREIARIVEAIAGGLISDALATRLKAAEVQHARLLAVGETKAALPRRPPTLPPEKRIEQMRARLAQGGEVARAVLRDLFPRSIWLEPDSSGQYLGACFGDEDFVSLLYDSPAEREAAIRAEFDDLSKSLIANESVLMVAGA